MGRTGRRGDHCRDHSGDTAVTGAWKRNGWKNGRPVFVRSNIITPDEAGVTVTATAATEAQTGVEMEALTATTVALLTLYDMAKALDKAMVIGDVRLMSKTGGKSGDWVAPGATSVT